LNAETNLMILGVVVKVTSLATALPVASRAAMEVAMAAVEALAVTKVVVRT
jgi:hypothetical protein